MAKRIYETTQGGYEWLANRQRVEPTTPIPPDDRDWRLVGVTSFGWRDEIVLVFAWELDLSGEAS